MAIRLELPHRVVEGIGCVNGAILCDRKAQHLPVLDIGRRELAPVDSIRVKELDDVSERSKPRYRVTAVDNLRSIASAVKDFQFFTCEKWRLASDKQGSGNTANIGSITFIEDIIAGNGVFAKLGEEWFDEYWMNHGVTTMIKKGRAVPIRSIEDFLDFKKGDKSKIVDVRTKKKNNKDDVECV